MAINGVTGGSGLLHNGAISIADLPPEVRRLIEQNQALFSEGDRDKIDTGEEAAKLLDLIGKERSLPNTPQIQGLSGDLLLMLIEWLQRQNNQPGGGGGGGGQHLGNLSGGGGGGRRLGFGGRDRSQVPAGPIQQSGPATRTADLRGNTNAERAFNYFVDKGLTPQQAAGIVGNLHAESGVNPGINEKNPIVAGSRGGYGIAQWTGPRRTQLEQFARARGTDVSDLGTQLDFLWSELQGPERRAFENLKRTTTAAEAAEVFSRDFERPGIVRMDARVSAANSALAAFGNRNGNTNA